MPDRIGVRAVLALVLFSLAAAACAGDDRGGGSDTTGGPAPGGMVPVTLNEFWISPAEIRVPAGEPLAFQVRNAGAAQHTFGIDVAGETVETPMIAPGATATLRVPALRAGTYRAYCTIPGHEDLGMVARLVVGPVAGAEQAAGTG